MNQETALVANVLAKLAPVVIHHLHAITGNPWEYDQPRWGDHATTRLVFTNQASGVSFITSTHPNADTLLVWPNTPPTAQGQPRLLADLVPFDQQHLLNTFRPDLIRPIDQLDSDVLTYDLVFHVVRPLTAVWTYVQAHAEREAAKFKDSVDRLIFGPHDGQAGSGSSGVVLNVPPAVWKAYGYAVDDEFRPSPESTNADRVSTLGKNDEITLYPGDCGSTELIDVYVDESRVDHLIGHNVVNQGQVVLLTKDNIGDYVNTVAAFRSAMTCRHRDGVCEVCNGVRHD